MTPYSQPDLASVAARAEAALRLLSSRITAVLPGTASRFRRAPAHDLILLLSEVGFGIDANNRDRVTASIMVARADSGITIAADIVDGESGRSLAELQQAVMADELSSDAGLGHSLSAAESFLMENSPTILESLRAR
jgi:hypothetical protein